MPNRLANETSPYLLQHKDNPVDWYPWGEEAFERARREDKPILLSVGYSACHWCHVMAHESFEDESIAALMNRDFVNVKVDREERPDVDGIYMQAVQALTGRGGWPMTVFLTPEGVPFYGGTYFPPEDRHGMPAFPRVLTAVAQAYRDKRSEIETAGRQLLMQLSAPERLRPGNDLLTSEALDRAAEAILQSHDDDFGGFGRAPKFPQAMTLDFLMRWHRRSQDARALQAVHKTLQAMAYGGIYDQVGGGFHRYSTDAVWLVPHFEKMLYDNALLARCYLDAYKLTREPLYRRIAEETLDYVLREMTGPEGGFYSSQDADSEGEEGRFFLWTPAELREVLGDDAEAIAAYFGVSEAGNFEGRNILHVPRPLERLPNGGGASDDAAFEALLQRARARLYEARERRVHPGRDDKVLTAWNGLMLRAFAEAALALQSAAYRDAAVRNADFLLREMRPNGRLLRTWKDGRARLNGYLEDYACLIDGLLAVHAATLNLEYLEAAVRLADEMIDLFWDDGVHGFFDTGRDHEALVTRPRDFFDNATPSGTSVAIDVLLRLAAFTDNPDHERRATACLRTLVPFVEQAPTAFGRLLAALDFHLAPRQELVIVLPAGASAAGAAERAAGRLLDPVRLRYAPNLLLAGTAEGVGGKVSPLFRDRPALDARPTAYLCEGFVCQAPTADPAELGRQLDAAI
ncbi:MAG TPA: thioredoxin domain-containing protein [Dehalococcoidia bacterium]|nr:thioredoxin domain-containing protein [Dehalococcoidia bacterium]